MVSMLCSPGGRAPWCFTRLAYHLSGLPQHIVIIGAPIISVPCQSAQPWRREMQKAHDDAQCMRILTGKCHVHGVDNVGTVPAAVIAYLAVHEFAPDLVISIGTAGGFAARGAKIGDVFLATGFANHDRRIPIPVLLHSLPDEEQPLLL